MPPPCRLSMQVSITVLGPKGRRGLNAPMRWDRPAARTMAATSRVFSLWFSVFVITMALFESTNTKDVIPKTMRESIHSQFQKSAKRILARHLFAPIHDEVGIVERTSFCV